VSGARSRPRRHLSIRRVSVASAIVIGGLSVVTALALVRTTSTLQGALATIDRDTRSLAIVDELNLSLLTYQRVSNLVVSTAEPRLIVARDEIAVEIDRLLGQAVASAGGAEEVALLGVISEQVSEYMAERSRQEARGPSLEEIVEATRAPFDRLLASMDSLRSLNEAQVEVASLNALRINRYSNVLGIVAALLLLSTLLVMVWGVQRYVLRPVKELQRTVDDLRHGHGHARASPSGLSELAELGGTFNEMADALGHVREGQLAFVAGVAHDLRDPLSSLKVGIHTLGQIPSPERRARALEMLDGQVDRLSRMVTDLLDAARLEAGRLELRPEEIDLREAAKEVVSMYGPTTQKHELALACSPEPATIRADPLRVQQVIGNLLSNAIKFSPRGGTIDIRVAADEAEAAVTVADQGIGLEPSEIDNLFLPFRRHRPDVAAGAGLGLSVVQRIVDAHGGRIDVDSEPGKGSRFTVSFPRASVA
jgi:two-component system, OmpR family, sensor histidine kinase MtrB